MARGTSEAISSIAARGMKKPETLTAREIKRVCASALAQDETARKLAAVHAALNDPIQKEA